MKEPISIQTGHEWSTGQGHEGSTLDVGRSKVKVTGGQSQIWRSGGIIIDPNRLRFLVSNKSLLMLEYTEMLPSLRGS